MPAKKQSAKRTTGSANGAKRVVSPEQRAAMAAGRTAARAINAYLTAFEENRPKRGRKVTKETLEQRLAEAQAEAASSTGTTKLFAIQRCEDIKERIAGLDAAATTDLPALEAEFVKVAKGYADAKGISYASWRTVGVPADVLKRAGITRSAS